MAQTSPQSGLGSGKPASDPAGEPRRGAADEKRRRILEAARRVCTRCGVDGTRMDEIAAEARVSKGTLYNYFDSKESLIVAGILAHYEATADRVMAEVPEELAPDAALDRLTEILVELFPEVLSEMLVNFQSWGAAVQHDGAREELFAALTHIYTARSRDMEALVAEGQRQGLFDASIDPALFTRSWLALYDGFVYRAAFDPQGATRESLHASLRDFVRRSLLRPPGAREDPR
ncbi:MAG: TetR/AcrR family transcriptional regulator [Myxococcota bacterium]